MPIIRDQEQRELKFSTFRVNEGVDAKASNVGRISEVADNMPIFSAEDYANYWTTVTKGGGISLNSLLKASGINVPPSVQSFASMSYMPNAQVSQFGILQWPGLPPQTLEKLAREHVGPQLIIGARQDDVLRYSELSTHPWRPGWQIVPRDNTPVTDSIRRDIREAELFVINSGNGKYTDARWRDSLYRVNFPKFLAEIVRNSLTFDGIAIWTDTNSKGEVMSYAPMPAQNIRLRARPTKNDATTGSTYHQGEINFYGQTLPDDTARVTFYNGPTNVKKVPNEDEVFAVAVDESGNIVQKFTRNDLIWYTRNPRVDVSAGNYGLPELETALTLITGFTNAIQFNAKLFDENSIPKALLTIKGNFSQRQFDAFSRVWDNLQRGPNTSWTLPAIQLSEKGALELISLEPLRKESAYYSNLVNMFMGALATVYRYPVHRLGYKISGTARDMRPDTPKDLDVDDDIGLPVLLTHLEIIMNDYILWTKWPHLKFWFTGKSPKENARLYEAQMLSLSFDERRLLVGMPKLVETVASPAAKEIAEIIGLAPTDPGLLGVYQSILAAKAKGVDLLAPSEGKGTGDQKDIEQPGARFPSKTDPGVSEDQGHMSGVRRDSKAEKEAAGNDSNGRPKTPPNLRLRDFTDYGNK